MTEIVKELVSIDRFINLFLAALVVRGKTEIWVRGPAAAEERRHMHALYEHLCKAVDTAREDCDKDYLYFIVRLRNHVAPSSIGSFDNLLHSILQKMLTIIEIDLIHCDCYRIMLQPITAKWYLEHDDPLLRDFTEKAADVYMESVKTRKP